MHKVKLPSRLYEVFGSRKKSECPYIKFYKWIVQQLPRPHELGEALYDEFNDWGLPTSYAPSVSAFKLTAKDKKRLDKLVKTWIKNYHYPTEFWADKAREQAFAMHNLQIGPSEFYNEDEPESGYVYIKTKWWEKQHG